MIRQSGACIPNGIESVYDRACRPPGQQAGFYFRRIIDARDNVDADRLNIENADALIAYLRRTGQIAADETPTVEVLTGGVSNRTVLVQREAERGDSWVIKQALRKLRVEVDWFSDPARVHREAAGLRNLAELLPAGAVPRFVFEDRHEHLFSMSAVPQPHENWKSQLLDGRLDATHVEQFAQMLGALHSRSAKQSDPLASEFGDRSFFETLRLEPYYGYAAEQVSVASTFLNDLIDDTRARQLTLVHGDYSPKNVLVRCGKLVLLDHEVIHWGDPGFDLGFSMTHFLSKAHFLPPMRDRFVAATRRYWEAYCDAAGCDAWQQGLEASAVRHTLGCLLARVAGRSPLEYLTEQQRASQQRAVISLINRSPATIDELIEQFIQELESNG